MKQERNVQEQELVTVPRESAMTVFTTEGAVQPYLDRIRAEIDAFQADVSTVTGRREIASIAYRVARTKTALEDVGKELADEVKAIPRKIDATRKHIRDTLDAWKDEVRKPLTDWEQAETARVAAHETNLASLVEAPGYGFKETSAEIVARIEHLTAARGLDWEEFAERAGRLLDDEIARMEQLLAAARKREAEAAELARLRQAQAERDAHEAAEAKKRAAAERAAEEARRVEEIARRRAEAAAEAERARAEEERLKAAAEQERIAAEFQRKVLEAEAAAQAARDEREAAERKAERDAQAAVEAERLRVALAAQKEAEERAAREADRAHRATINRAAVRALITGGVDGGAAKIVVAMIAKQMIPNVSITY